MSPPVPLVSRDLWRGDLVEFLGVITVFVVGEGLILYQYGEYGLLVHGVGIITLFALINANDGATAFLYQSMLLVPVLRIVNLGIPILTSNPLMMLAILYSFVGVSVLMILRSQDCSVAQIGLTRQSLLIGLLGVMLGAPLGVVQYSLSLESIVYERTIRNHVLLVLTAGVLVGFVEEIIFRGLIQRWAAVKVGNLTAIVGTSVLFGAMHSVWLTPLNVVFAGMVSMLFGAVYIRTNNMWFIATAHGMINVMAFLLAPLYLN